MKQRYAMIAIDCDPDRNMGGVMSWKGIEKIEEILGLALFTLNIRSDGEILGYYGAQNIMFDHPIVNKAKRFGCSIGTHFHLTNERGEFDKNGVKYLINVPRQYRISIHDGWCNHEIIGSESKLFKVNFSPCPGGRGPHYDWIGWSRKITRLNDMLFLPTHTMRHRLNRAYNNFATVHTTAPPYWFKRLINHYEKVGKCDTLVTYFHADELGCIGDWRDFIYSKTNLINNIKMLRKRGYILQNVRQVYRRIKKSHD